MTTNGSPSSDVRTSLIRQFGPIVVLVVALAALFALGPDDAAIYQALREHRVVLRVFVAEHAVLATAVYFVVYALVIAFSLPGGAMMTMIGGFLFGPLRATVYVVFAATVGATAVFLLARSAVGDRLRARAGPWMQRMQGGFQENALSYLLFLRLVPVFPFFVINLVPAFLGVRLRTYVIGTFFGIMPGTVVFALAGAGLGRMLEAGRRFDASSVLTPEIVGALVGLALLAMVPVIYKKVRTRKFPR